jgi:imidazolonepropionase-like amidohydrolase
MLSIQSLSWAIAVILCVISIEISAQNVIAIKADHIIDGTGAPPIEDGVIIVRGDRIEAVGPRSAVQIPDGAKVIDLPGETLLPGLIDGHNHLSIRYGIALDSGTPRLGNPGMMEQMMQPDAIQTIRMVRHARVALLSGVTAMRLTGEAHHNDQYVRDGIRNGLIPGPRLLISGFGLLGETDPDTSGRWVKDPSGLHLVPLPNWKAVQKVRENFNHGAEWIKVSLYGQTPEVSSLAFAELVAIVEEAHRLGMKVAAHATGTWGRSMKDAIRAGVDTIEHARPMTPEIIDMMVEYGTAVCFTPLVYVGFRPDESTWKFMDTGSQGPADWINFQKKQYFEHRKAHPEVETQDRPYDDFDENRRGRDFSPSIRTQQTQVLAAFKAGIPVSLGMDPLYVGGLGNAIEFLIEGGFTPMDAIRAGTAVSAQNIGLGDDLGTLEPGKLADIISLKANPLEERWAWDKIHLVMKGGERYDTLSWR